MKISSRTKVLCEIEIIVDDEFVNELFVSDVY